MADSTITKRALAGALKELMTEFPFSKICISDICDRCYMNRKSFYYHFRDKYDLVNWIFDTETAAAIRRTGSANPKDMLSAACCYFYENRAFYRKALAIQGQNSLADHFRELLSPLFERMLEEKGHIEHVTPFHVNFLCDAFLCTIRRWLMEAECMEPQAFISSLLDCVGYISHRYDVYTEDRELSAVNE